MISRRSFVLDGSAALAAMVSAPFSFALPAAQSKARHGVEGLGYADFAALIGSAFQFRLPSGAAADLKLIKVRLAPRCQVAAGRRPPVDADYEKFSLIFSGPRHLPLASAIHACEHPELGRFEMHLGEIGARESEDLRYEAVFNQPARTPRRRTTFT